MIRHTKTPGLDVPQNSFRYRAAKSYNELPEEIRNIDDEKKFKIAVKNWILKNLE